MILVELWMAGLSIRSVSVITGRHKTYYAFSLFSYKKGKIWLVQPELPWYNNEILRGYMFALKWCVTYEGEKILQLFTHAHTHAHYESIRPLAGIRGFRGFQENSVVTPYSQEKSTALDEMMATTNCIVLRREMCDFWFWIRPSVEPF